MCSFTGFLFHGDYDGRYDMRYGSFSLPIGVLVQWRFYPFEILSVYANLGGGVWPRSFRDDHFYYRGGGTLIRGFPLFALGANLHFTRGIGMSIEFGYPAARIGLNVGSETGGARSERNVQTPLAERCVRTTGRA